jgi:chaperone modulatory protein CbpM
MIARADVLLRIGIAEETLEAWCAAGWLRPAEEWAEADIARALLIRDLIDILGVNEEGVEVALSLLDQIHGLRRALRAVAAVLEALPAPLREELRAAIAAAEGGDAA